MTWYYKLLVARKSSPTDIQWAENIYVTDDVTAKKTIEDKLGYYSKTHGIWPDTYITADLTQIAERPVPVHG